MRAELRKNNIESLNGRWFPLNPKALKNSEQKRLHSDLLKKKFRNIVVAAGRRSFKTERFAKRYLVNQCLREENDGKIYYAGAPTRQQAKEIFWSDLKKLAPRELIKNISEVDLKLTFQGDSVIRVIGLREFKRIQGQLMHGIVITEYQDCDPGVYNESIEPMINDTRGWCIKEGRPFGKNHFFDDFLRGKAKEKGWRSYHWTSEEILTDEQIAEAKSNLARADYERESRLNISVPEPPPLLLFTVLSSPQPLSGEIMK